MTRAATVFDVRSPRWGCMIEQQWGQGDPMAVQGCLNPRPIAGDYVVGKDGRIFRFAKVDPMGNPSDGFFAVMEAMGCAIDPQEALPTASEIEAFLAAASYPDSSP